MKNAAIALILALSVIGSAQQQTVKPATVDAQVPPGTVVIDGSQNPNAISDSTAIRLFYAAARPKTDASSSESHPAFQTAKRFLDKLTAEEPNDAALLKSKVANWAISHATAFTPGQTTPPTSQQYYEDIERAGVTELATLHASMSAHGWELLIAELTRRKATVKVYKYPASVTNH